jgi:hypothetical protein
MTDCFVLRILFNEHIFYVYYDIYDGSYVLRGKINNNTLCSYNITDAHYVVNFIRVFYEDEIQIRVDLMNYQQLPYQSQDIYFEQFHEYNNDGHLMKTVLLRDQIISHDQSLKTIADELYHYVRLCENTYNIY